VIFIGDVHSEFGEYWSMLKSFGGQPSIQLGDMGVGFSQYPYIGIGYRYDEPWNVPYHHHFIRGNHDNPQKCQQMIHYLGDFGYFDPHGIFFVSGAASPDFYRRIPHVNWWEDEQLPKYRMDKALELYEQTKPKIVATHDCPLFLLNAMYSKSRVISTATGKLFDAMFEIHRPDVWVFAHHHKSLHFSVKGTEFFCLKILEALKLTETTVSADYLGEGLKERETGDEEADLHGRTTESGQVDSGS